MSSFNSIGNIEVLRGKVEVIDIDGTSRIAKTQESLYENEILHSDDVDAQIIIGYHSLLESTDYKGVFTVLLDSSVTSGLDGDDNLLEFDSGFMHTAFNDTLDLSNVEALTSGIVIENIIEVDVPDIDTFLEYTSHSVIDYSDLISHEKSEEVSRNEDIVNDIYIDYSNSETPLIDIDDVISVD